MKAYPNSKTSAVHNMREESIMEWLVGAPPHSNIFFSLSISIQEMNKIMEQSIIYSIVCINRGFE